MDKYLVDSRARRALLYPNRLLAEDFARDKDVFICRGKSILGDNVLVVPRGRQMFAPKEENAVTHGGIHIEEVIALCGGSVMIGFDRPLKPRWIYETLLLVKPGQKLSELNDAFEKVARELTGKEGKRKVRTVLFAIFYVIQKTIRGLERSFL